MKTSYAITVSALLIMGVAPQAGAADDPPYMIRCAKYKTCWDADSKFKPVPAELQAKGNKICENDRRYSKESWTYAVGWHPDARDLNGKRIPGGGFNCGDSKKRAQLSGPGNSSEGTYQRRFDPLTMR